ncbi:MAG: Ig-like domain-containing protein [Anaerolineae bacterium]
MNCKRIRPLLSAYHDGELDPAQQAEVEAHLAACLECAHTLDGYRSLGQDVRGLPNVRPPAGMQAEFEKRLHKLSGSSLFGARGMSLRRGLAATAFAIALVALALGVYAVLRQMQLPEGTVTVASVYPESGATDVPLDANLIIIFAQPMDRASVEEATSIIPEKEMAFGWKDQTLTIVPFANWEPATTYTLTVATTALSVDGMSLEKPLVLSFTTEEGQAPSGGGLNPLGRFGLIWRAEFGGPGGTMGYATDVAQELWSATQPFERGRMIWVDYLQEDTVYVLSYGADERGGTWEKYVDTFREGDLESSGLTPPEGKLESIRGFGKVWRDELGGPDAPIGWALTPEQGYVGEVQFFEHGLMLWNPLDGTTYVLLDDGVWGAYPLSE